MPYIKSKDIRAAPLSSLKYICNSEKPEGGLLVSAVNCMNEPRNAYEEMKRVYEFYSGRSFNEPIPENGKGRVKLIHYIQSFDPQDNVTPEQANKAALATVSEMFGENVQAVIATHVNTKSTHNHIIINVYDLEGKRFYSNTKSTHNHIIINVYDLEGKRFYSNQTSLKKLKLISDSCCLRYGIKPYNKNAVMAKTKISDYSEWSARKAGTSWKQKIRDEIDGIIPSVKNIDELICELQRRGYIIKRGKYISVKFH